MKKTASLKAVALAVASVVSISGAQAGVLGDGWNAPTKLFENYASDTSTTQGRGGYRIPAITSTSQGTVIALVDKRFDGTQGNTDLVQGSTVHKVWFSYKVSKDGGRSWSKEFELKPPTFNVSNQHNTAKNYITDPQIVHNSDTGTTFAFGYQSNSALTVNGDFDIFMFKSQDGGFTWDEGQSIKNSVNLGNGFHKALQGPGKGMYYNGTLYVPIQKFGPKTSSSSSYVASSGFLYSTDNGQTWEQSNWIINDASSINGSTDSKGNSVSSESSIFHHDGYIYLVGKRDPANDKTNNRLVWRTKDNGQTWEEAPEETFITKYHNVAGCETSTLALTDQIYFVGYSLGESWRRYDTYLTTNKGRRIKLYERNDWNKNETYGYTSISSDADNIYVLFEGITGQPDASDITGAILMQNFDYAGKDYANLNARLLRSSKDLRYIQGTVMNTKDTYVRSSFGEDSHFGAEAVLVRENAKLAFFHKRGKDIGDDIYRTYAYDEATTSALVEFNHVLFNDHGFLSDSVFGGYQYNNVDYVNGATDEVHSIIAGYALNVTTDYFDYTAKLNGKISKHDFNRNNREGLNKTADFNSKVFSISNEFSKSFELFDEKLSVRPFVGLDSTYFEHDNFTEENGNDFNDITVHQSSNWSHGLYLGAQLNGTYPLNYGMSLDYSAHARYVRELSDIDDWTDSYTVFDADFMFASPVNKSDQENVFEASASAVLNINKHVGFGIGANFDSANENMVFGQLKIKF